MRHFLLILTFLLSPVASLYSSEKKVEIGRVSYYSHKLQGRKMTNGECYSSGSFVAAHRRYPLGTILKVTNVENGKFVLVRVTDRGPYHCSRVIDISFAAAVSIDMVQSGHAIVSVEEADRLRDFFYTDSLSLKYSILFIDCCRRLNVPDKFIFQNKKGAF